MITWRVKPPTMSPNGTSSSQPSVCVPSTSGDDFIFVLKAACGDRLSATLRVLFLFSSRVARLDDGALSISVTMSSAIPTVNIVIGQEPATTDHGWSDGDVGSAFRLRCACVCVVNNICAFVNHFDRAQGGSRWSGATKMCVEIHAVVAMLSGGASPQDGSNRTTLGCEMGDGV